MLSRLSTKPQLLMLLVGGWLVVFGLSGTLARQSESDIGQKTVPLVNVEGHGLKVTPATQRPGSTIDQLQGAQNLQQQGGEALQQQDQQDLQPNSGLSGFPSGNGRLQQ